MAENLNYPEKITISKPKRTFDIIISLFLILFFLPLLFFIALGIFIEHALIGCIFAPIIYREKRFSQGKEFDFLKFNIFQPKAIEEMEKKNIFIHTKVLEREKKNLTAIGFVVKQIYLDELPQLFAVVMGDLSMVGPRPANKEIYDLHIKRGNTILYQMKAGITGNYQSLKGITAKTEYELDKEYLDFCSSHSSHQILLFDLKILLRTVKVILRAKGI